MTVLDCSGHCVTRLSQIVPTWVLLWSLLWIFITIIPEYSFFLSFCVLVYMNRLSVFWIWLNLTPKTWWGWWEGKFEISDTLKEFTNPGQLNDLQSCQCSHYCMNCMPCILATTERPVHILYTWVSVLVTTWAKCQIHAPANWLTAPCC